MSHCHASAAVATMALVSFALTFEHGTPDESYVRDLNASVSVLWMTRCVEIEQLDNKLVKLVILAVSLIQIDTTLSQFQHLLPRLGIIGKLCDHRWSITAVPLTCDTGAGTPTRFLPRWTIASLSAKARGSTQRLVGFQMRHFQGAGLQMTLQMICILNSIDLHQLLSSGH